MSEALAIFCIGVAAGALAIYVPWCHPDFKKYVLPCGNGNCPHHGPEIRRRISETNERERRKPPRI